MTAPKKYPVNLTVKLVLNIEPGENGEYPSRFDVENAARLALIDGIERLDQNAMRGGLSEGIQDYLEDEDSDAAGPTVYKDYSEVTLHEEQPAELGLVDEDVLGIFWSVEDVLTVAPHLSRDQARDVLHEARRYHDANVGINWGVLKEVASQMEEEHA